MRTVKFLLATVLATSSLGLGLATATANTTGATATCQIQAQTPNNSNNAWLGRADCSNRVSVNGKIIEDRSGFPDDVILSHTFMGGVKYFDGSCGNGVGYYFSQVKSSTGASGTSALSRNCD